jgi:hypothetical protein
MGKFIHPKDGQEPLGRFKPGGINFELHEALIYQPSLIFEGSVIGTITVPAGAVSDFASVPRFFWRIVSPIDADVRLPALVHDYLYTTQLWPKKVADLIFREALIAHGAPAWKRTAMYQAVNWCGGKAWRDHTEEKAIRALTESPGKN